MSYSFGAKSLENFKTLHPDLQKILAELIMIYDFSIIEGHRTLETQQQYFKDGKSKLDGIDKKSKHQSLPSMAVDIMPYYKNFNPFIDRNGDKAFYYMAGLLKGIAEKLLQEGDISHKITWGGNWDNDMDFFNDSKFFDLPHFQLDNI